MSAYRMYFLIWGQIQGREDFEAADDVAAIRIAGVLYDTCSDVCDGFAGEPPTSHATTTPSESQPHRFNRGSSARRTEGPGIWRAQLAAGGVALANAVHSASSLLSSNEVRITVPPSPCRAARTLSVVILRTSRKSVASPDWRLRAASRMNRSLMPTSASAPPSAPEAAPIAAPASGIRKIMPIRAPQKVPETAPDAVGLKSRLSLTRPLGCLTAITASDNSIKYSFCISSSFWRTCSAFSSDGNVISTRSAICVYPTLGSRLDAKQ